MNKASLSTLGLLASLAGCADGGGNVADADEANVAAQEGVDLNSAIGGDELSPIPEAEDDMIANDGERANVLAPAPLPAPAPAPVPLPAPRPQGR